MTEPDDVLDILRRARPDDLTDDLASPRSPAAQALLEKILSAPPTPVPGTRDDVVVIGPAVGAARRRRVLVGVAAAAVTAIIAGGVLTVSSSEPTAAATIDAAVARTSELMGLSGRAEQHYRFEIVDATPAVEEWTYSYEFSGDDVSVTSDANRFIFRVVDGQAYGYSPVDPNANVRDESAPFQWWHIPGNYDPDTYEDGETGPFGLDPRTLLETLSSAGGFEVVGNEDVDGVPTRQLRAADPDEALDVGQLRQGVDGTATSLEVWVDDDDLVRRVDFRIEEPWDLAGATWSVSIRFFDLGEPIVIEAPVNAPDWVPPPDVAVD